MEIVIHGTKGGYKNNFIPYATSSFAVGDIRRGSADENPVGQSAYSIAFDNKGYIVTKYIIIRDTLRSYAVGFIGFSLFLPADKELSGKGASIQSLLDEVSDLYKEDYIKSNNINCDKTTLIQEDWSFISQITAKYQEQTNPNEEQIDSISRTNAGTEFPAFIYYSSDEELQKYFDTPFQEEYKKYQQVLFIKEELKDKKENPLHILRNSGYNLTEEIDLINPIYKIVNHSQSLKSINDTSLSLFDKRIRKSTHLRLKWSKQYYSDIMKIIVISEDNNDPSISIDHAKHIIMIQEPTEWIPQTKTIKIEVVDYNGNPIKDVQIYTEKKIAISDGVFTLEGENIGKSWRIIAEHEELKGEKEIQPNSQDRICITLHKSKVIELKINNNGDGKRYTIRSDNSQFINIREKGSNCYSLEFRDSAIENQFNYRIWDNNVFCQKGSFIPNDIKEKEYIIDLENLPQQEKSSKDHSLRKQIKKVIVIILVSCILSLIGIGIEMEVFQNQFINKKTKLSEIKESDIQLYIEGKHFKTDSLNTLFESWEKQKPHIKFRLLKLSTWLSRDTVDPDSEDYKEWKKIKTDIERAVSIRSYIDNKEFAALKDSTFSSEQQPFKNAIKDIDDDVIAALNDLDIPNMTLSEIKDSIKNINKRLKELYENPEEPKLIVDYIKKSPNYELDSIDHYYKNFKLSSRLNKSLKLIRDFLIKNNKNLSIFFNEASNDTFISQNINHTDWAKRVDSKRKYTAAQQDKLIIALLQNDQITKDQLNDMQYRSYKESAKLYLEFWRLVSTSKSKDEFTDLLNNKIKKDSVLEKSKLRDFLELICKNSNDFENNFAYKPGRDTFKNCKSLSELKEKLNIK